MNVPADVSLPWLNYHHLRVFWVIALEGTVTVAAEKLRLSQSTLSLQLKALEDSLGAKLFERKGRLLELTAAGQVAFRHAEEIFRSGNELRAWFANHENSVSPRQITIGALNPMSKNLQYEMIHPIVMEGETLVRVVEGEQEDLILRLRRHELDMLLSNVSVQGAEMKGVSAHLLGEMPVYLVGRAPYRIPKRPFPEWLKDIPLFLPTSRTSAREGFDALMIRHGIRPNVRAEVDEPALLRLLALSGGGLALVPEIGVKFELEARRLLKVERVEGLKERFYAFTARQNRLPPILLRLIENAQRVLGARRSDLSSVG